MPHIGHCLGLPWHTSAALDVRDWCSRLGRDSTDSQYKTSKNFKAVIDKTIQEAAERCGKEIFFGPPPILDVKAVEDVDPWFCAIFPVIFFIHFT